MIFTKKNWKMTTTNEDELYENPWIYDGGAVLGAPADFYGFVYEITNKTSGKKYIGKKFFWSKVSKPPLKGKTRRRRSIKESDWKTYYGSNKEIQEDVKTQGASNFERKILHLCVSKGECTYYECKYQFDNAVLESDNYYNEWIICKVHRKHIGKLI
jgi:hypothetical protein